MSRLRTALEIRPNGAPLDFLERALHEHGWVILSVPSVEAALGELQQVRPALILVRAAASGTDICQLGDLLRCPFRAGVPVVVEQGIHGALMTGPDLVLAPGAPVAGSVVALARLADRVDRWAGAPGAAPGARALRARVPQFR